MNSPTCLMRIAIAIPLLILPSSHHKGLPSSGDVDYARLFSEGRFPEAASACREALERDPKDLKALLIEAKAALFSNQLKQSEHLLEKADLLDPGNKEIATLWAEALVRGDNFAAAARHLRAAGKGAKANQLESFAGKTPYHVNERFESEHIKFIQTDPLPLIAAKVNDGPELFFLIDTGGAETLIDPEVAQKAGARTFGQETGTFAGGGHSSVELGSVDSIRLGNLTISNVPVQILNTKRFSAVAQGRAVAGVIGTKLLYHFQATLDYPGGQLVLKRASAKNLSSLDNELRARGSIAVPFWLAGDHYMVAWGSVNKAAPVLMFIDTGLAGAAYTGPRWELDAAGITLPEGKEAEGIGGAGKVSVIPFALDQIALGEARQQHLSAFFGPFPPSLEENLGFRLGGIISHQFFRPYSVTFDFTYMRLLLRPEA